MSVKKLLLERNADIENYGWTSCGDYYCIETNGHDEFDARGVIEIRTNKPLPDESFHNEEDNNFYNLRLCDNGEDGIIANYENSFSLSSLEVLLETLSKEISKAVECADSTLIYEQFDQGVKRNDEI